MFLWEFMSDDLITKIEPEELRIALFGNSDVSLEEFIASYKCSDFLVSHGAIKKEDPNETQRLVFLTSSGGGMKDLVLGLHPLESLVYELAWDKIDWSAVTMSNLWVGRASNCSVQIVHSNVSKLHGYFKYRRGQVLYADAGSTNGSSVDRVKIAPNSPVSVKSCSCFNLGGVKLTFYSAKDFYSNVIARLKEC